MRECVCVWCPRHQNELATSISAQYGPNQAYTTPTHTNWWMWGGWLGQRNNVCCPREPRGLCWAPCAPCGAQGIKMSWRHQFLLNMGQTKHTQHQRTPTGGCGRAGWVKTYCLQPPGARGLCWGPCAPCGPQGTQNELALIYRSTRAKPSTNRTITHKLVSVKGFVGTK